MMGRLGRWISMLGVMAVMLGFPPRLLAQEFLCPPDAAETADEIRELARQPGMGESVRPGYLMQAAEWDAWADEWIAFGAQQPAAGAGTQPAWGSSSAEQPVATAGGGSFQSQNHGFGLEWGPEWTVVEQGSAGSGMEGLYLSNGTSHAGVAGITTTDIPQVTVERLAARAQAPLFFDTVMFDESDRAAAYYMSADQETGVFIDAIVLDQQSTMVVNWIFPTAQYDTEFDRFVSLMDGLRF